MKPGKRADAIERCASHRCRQRSLPTVAMIRYLPSGVRRDGPTGVHGALRHGELAVGQLTDRIADSRRGTVGMSGAESNSLRVAIAVRRWER